MKTTLKILRLSAVVMLLTSMVPAFAAEELAAQTVAKEARCPVCGMYPSRYPKWMAQVAFKDRAIHSFDSPAELFRFLQNIAKYDAQHGTADVGAIFLTDYAKGGWIEAKRTFLVNGSTAKGPMNNEDLPAFDSKEAAEQFAKGNGGKVLPFDKVTPEIIKALDNPHGHGHEHQDHGH